MVNFCAVFGCSNRSNRDKVSFYRFPYAPKRFKESVKAATEDRRRQWLNAIRRKDLDENRLKYARVCSKHFHSGKPAALDDITNPDWIPSLNMGLNKFLKMKRKAENKGPTKAESKKHRKHLVISESDNVMQTETPDVLAAAAVLLDLQKRKRRKVEPFRDNSKKTGTT